MLREEAIKCIRNILKGREDKRGKTEIDIALEMAIKALEQESCEDCISRQVAITALWKAMFDYATKMEKRFQDSDELDVWDWITYRIYVQNMNDIDRQTILNLPPVAPQSKIGHCRDCKWWKDSDGLYRRDGHAESQCPINRREVFEGNGYCYMYKPQESEE